MDFAFMCLSPSTHRLSSFPYIHYFIYYISKFYSSSLQLYAFNPVQTLLLLFLAQTAALSISHFIWFIHYNVMCRFIMPVEIHLPPSDNSRPRWHVSQPLVALQQPILQRLWSCLCWALILHLPPSYSLSLSLALSPHWEKQFISYRIHTLIFWRKVDYSPESVYMCISW